MKKIVLFLTLVLTLSFGALSAANLVSENISTWTSHASYGTWTQAITAGTVNMTACIVAPTGAASGTGTVGYVQMQATNGILEIPSLASIGTIEFRIHAGGTGRTLKLQQYVGASWTDVTTFTIGTTGTTFTYNMNTTAATRIRLAVPSAAVYVHDIIITDYATGSIPAAPNATAASALTATGFTANWDASSGATSYRLDVSTSNTFASFVTGYQDLTVSGLTQAVSGLTAATTYYYRVRANNTYGTSADSNVITAITESIVVIPVAPTATAAASITTSGFTANWNTVSNATSYRLDVSTSNTFGTFVSGYNNLTVAGLSQAVTGLAAGTTYYYRVRANNSAGTSVDSNVITAVTSSVTIPVAPTATAATSITSSGFTANWNTVSNATSYRLDVSTSNTFGTFVTGYNNLTVAGLSQAVTGLAVGTNYYYRVRAYNTAGTSGNSGTITATTSATDPFNGYYTPVTGLTGDALKTGLRTLISTNTNTSYDGAKLFMFQTADNIAGVVRCVYTGQDYTVSSSYDGASNPNTEHTFAQSWFGTTDASKKKADIHHLYPTNSTVNSTRGNYPFDVVANVTTTFPSYNSFISKKGTNATGQIVFEPANQHKGDLARALLYFSVRYNMSLSIGGVDMLPTMITWNSSDPVDARELARNASIYSYMGNRNPFVDHPEYVTSIWGGSTANTTIQFSPASAVVNESAGTVTLTVSISNPSATAATTAQIQLTDGSVSDVNNYATQTVTFPAGSSASRSITITITDDAIIEGDETLVFTLANVSGGTSATVGAYDSFNLTIIDNELPVVTAIAATSITDTGFTANWAAASGITIYEFDLSTSIDFSTFVTGYEAFPVTGTTVALTGLTAGTTYFYRVRASFNDTPGSNSNVITAVTTGGSSSTVILTEGFESALTATPPTGWSLSATGSYILANIANAHGGTHYAGTNALNGWVRTSLLVNPTQMTFWAKASGTTSNYTIIVQASTDGTIWADMATYAANGTDTGTMTSTYALKTVALNLTGSYYLRWNMSARTSGSMYFDDVEVTSGSVTPTAPAAPVATAATSLTTSGFTANWEASATATGYRLDVSTSNVFASYVTGYSDLAVSGLTQSVSGLTASTTYYYRVRAENAAGTSTSSNMITAITATTPVLPDAPVATGATSIAATGFTANWNVVATATGYRLDVSTSNVFASYVTGYQDLTVVGLTQAVTGLSSATTYYYRVRAVNAAGTSINSNMITAVTSTVSTSDLLISEYLEGASNNKAIEIYNPTAGAINLATYTVNLSRNGAAWSASPIALTGSVAAGDVFVIAHPSSMASILALGDMTSTSLDFNGNDAVGLYKSGVLIDVIGIPALATGVPGVGWDVAGTVTATANRTLIRKLAVSQGNTNWATSAGTDSSSSEWIVYPIDTITGLGLHNIPGIPPTAPVAIAATDTTTTGFTAKWNAVATATGYRLDVSLTNTFTTNVTGYSDLTVSGLSQAVTGLTEGTTYYYRVRAVDANGTSANSNTITVITATTPVMPSVPVATAATSIGTTSFTANWDLVANADSYRLDVSLSNAFATYVTGYQDLTVTGLTQAVSGLSSATTYFYRVRAVSTVGTSANSNVITVETGSIVTTPELFLSEYIEGSSNNKAIEIYNPTTAAVDLSVYSLKLASNGGAWGTTPIALTGTLAANDVYVVSHTLANATILALADQTSASLSFNGNDAVGLYKNGVLIDVIGVPSLSTSVPALGWDVAAETTATANHTLVRKSATIHGNTDWAAAAGTTIENSEWTVYAVDILTYLGSHTGPSALIEAPAVTITNDIDNVFLTWNDVVGAASYRIEASDSPAGTYTDVSLQGTFDNVAGVNTWKLTVVDNQKFFKVYAVTAAK